MKLVTGDIIHGYAIPLPLNKIIQIPHICMAPLHIQAQWTINEFGEIVAKDCLIHDQSFKWETSKTSVKSHCNPSTLQKCMFGKCLLRLINWIVVARWKYPNCKIFEKRQLQVSLSSLPPALVDCIKDCDPNQGAIISFYESLTDIRRKALL